MGQAKQRGTYEERRAAAQARRAAEQAGLQTQRAAFEATATPEEKAARRARQRRLLTMAVMASALAGGR